MKARAALAVWAALVAAAGATSWLVFSNQENNASAPAAQPAGATPDYTLHDAVVTRYDDAGSARYVLDSATIVHMPASGESMLGSIRFHYYAPSGTSWELTAQRGALSADGDKLALAGDVRGRQLAAADPIRFAAPEASVEFEQRTVHSDAHVRLWQAGYEIEGIGLAANLDAGTLEVLKDVSGRYAP